MVGVPGRSKGCNTCLRRKIRCDQGKPWCGNCLRSNESCAGYTRKTVYVFSENVALTQADINDLGQDGGTTAFHGWSRIAGKPAPRPHTATEPRPGMASGLPVTWTPAGDTVQQCSEVPAAQKLPTLSSARLNDLSVLWQPLHQSFMTIYVPRSEHGAYYYSETEVNGNWIVQLRGSVIDSPALQTSVSANAAAHLAREHGDSTLLVQSREMYMRSLQHLQRALRKRSTRLSDETLATCLALSMYDLAEGSGAGSGLEGRISVDADASGSGRGRNTHLMGAMALVEMRGPDVNISPLAHSLFLGLRRFVLPGTLMNEQETFLTQEQWKYRPWAMYQKNRLDTCLDTLFETPAVMRQWTNVKFESNETLIQEKCDSILHRCDELDAILEDWFLDYQCWHGRLLYHGSVCKIESSFDSEENGKVFPVAFRFNNFPVAYVLITYWSGKMIVHNLSMDANYKLASSFTKSSPRRAAARAAAAQRHMQIWVTMVRNMCQSIEYLTSRDAGRLGLTVATGALRGCIDLLRGGPEPWERERGWIAEMLNGIGTRLHLRG